MISYTEHRLRRFGDAPVIDPETRWMKIRGVTLALIFGAFGLICYWLIWKPCAWVVQAFKDLLEDETLIEDAIKENEKNKRKGG